MKKSLLILISLLLTACVACGSKPASTNESDVPNITSDSGENTTVTEPISSDTIIETDEVIFDNDAITFTLKNGKYYLTEKSTGYESFIDIEPRDLVYIDEVITGNLLLIDNDFNCFRIAYYLDPLYIDITPREFLHDFGSFKQYALIGDYLEFGLILDNDGNFVKHTFGQYEVHDNLLFTTDGRSGCTWYTIYNSELEQLYDGILYNVSLLSDGRVLAMPNIFGESTSKVYHIYSPDGKLEFESRDYDSVLFTIGDIILVVDDGMAKLLTLDGSELAELFEWKEEYVSYHGYYIPEEHADEESPSGYYFCFELDGYYRYRYVPDTGEVIPILISGDVTFM